MGVEADRFPNGLIDLSTMRHTFDPQKVLETIPSHFQAKDESGNELLLETLSAVVHPKGVVYIVMTDNIEGEPPFLMTATHKNNELQQDLTPATEAEFYEYQGIMADYSAEQMEKEILEAEELAEEKHEEGEQSN